ncbi:MAG: sigma 54-interacting transcriptional regulator, partial [Atribacterota bacterium]
MNKYLLTLVISVLCLVFFIFFGYQRLSNVVVSNILHRLNTGSVRFSFREVRYLFPFSLEIRDIQVENQGSILQSPLALITLDWNFIFGRKASLRIDLPQAQLYSDPTDFFQKMKAFRIEKVPDFTLSIHKLDFSQSLLLNRSFQVDLTKNQETLLFAIRSSQIEVSGTIEDSQRLRAHFQMISGYSSGAGNIQWNYQDNLVSGSFESPVPFSFSAELFPQKNGELELHHIEVKSPGASPFSFIGEGSFQMGNDPFCQMKGTIREEKKGRNFQMEASFRPLTQPVEGTFRLQSKDPDFSFHTSFRLNPNDSTFTLTVLPGSTAYRCPVEGGVKGSYQGGKVMVDVKTSLLNLQFPELLPEFVGKGSFAGHFSYEKKQLKEKNIVLKEQLQRIELHDRLIGESKKMREVKKFISLVSTSNVPVLVLGETGTGKELVARAIHALSARSANPFVAINASCLQENILESELFGYKKGAFTGAQTDKVGLLEIANK